MEPEISNNIELSRFERQQGDHVAFVKYSLAGSTLTLVHTEVPPELGGQGIGGKLVQVALAFARDNGLTVVTECPFARRYIEKQNSSVTEDR